MVHLILKKHLKVRKIFARWVPHLLTDEQNRQRDKVAKICFKCFKLVTIIGGNKELLLLLLICNWLIDNL